MRRTVALLTTLFITALTLVGITNPAHAVPSPSEPSCALAVTPTIVGNTTQSVTLKFKWFGLELFTTPAWSYEVHSVDTAAKVASNSFPHGNDLDDTITTAAWNTGSYTAKAYSQSFGFCAVTFQVQGVAVPATPTPPPAATPTATPTAPPAEADLPPTVTIECGPSEVVVGSTINVKGTATDDKGIAADAIRFPDGTETVGNTGNWQAAGLGEIAFAYFVTDTGGHQVSDLCRIDVVAAPATPTATPAPAPVAPPENVDAEAGESESADGTGEIDEAEAGETASETSVPTPKTGQSPDAETGDGENSASNAEAEETAEANVAAPTDDVGDDDDQLAAVTTTNTTGFDQSFEAALEADASATDALTEAIETLVATNASNDVQPLAAPTESPGGINVPWWFLIVLLALAAYKPVTDLWRTVTQPGRVRSNQNPTAFDA